MYESRTQTPLTRRKFAARMAGHAAVVIGLLAFSLMLGMAGYIGFESLSWADAFLNTAMLLGGMGPVNPPQTEADKLFAGLFALYAGLVFIVAAALVFAPALHRLLHRFHWDDRG
jgi:flagellar biosynthesis protein FliR